MNEIDRYRERVNAARLRLSAVPMLGRGEQGPPDETTGERWDRGNVLGHLAEMLPFWCGQVDGIRAGAHEFGRGESGYAQRRDAIDRWSSRDETGLRAEIGAGLEGLLRLLDGLEPGELEKRAVYRSLNAEREVDLRYPLEELLIGHLEEHVRQLELLGQPG